MMYEVRAKTDLQKYKTIISYQITPQHFKRAGLEEHGGEKLPFNRQKPPAEPRLRVGGASALIGWGEREGDGNIILFGVNKQRWDREEFWDSPAHLRPPELLPAELRILSDTSHSKTRDTNTQNTLMHTFGVFLGFR